MIAARRHARARHLLEVGVRWPPESFVAWKLEGLAARGLRVTVASRSIFDPAFSVPGVELMSLPSRPFAHRYAAQLSSIGNASDLFSMA